MMSIDNQENTEALMEEYSFDYCRIRTAELLCKQIREEEIDGCIAEAGVYYGLFAKLLNKQFPDRKLYLYDTFGGFDEDQLERDIQEGFIENNIREMVINYGKGDIQAEERINQISKKMSYPENCIFRKGFFPDSAKDDTNLHFAFVSLDMDLYEPMLAGLEFFYPRLASNGYIYIHDYNSADLHGAYAAVKHFEEKYGKIIKIPVSDASGSIIITRN